MSGPEERVVVTGVGLVSALGVNVDTLWRRLNRGESAVCEHADLRSGGYRSALAARLDCFEADPLRRGLAMALAAVGQAMEQSGITPPARVGVYVGGTMGESAAFERAAEGEPIDVADYGIPSFSRGIRDRYDLGGPHQSFGTACAAGNYAVGAGLDQLRTGIVSVAIAGGVEPFSRLSHVGFGRARAMASDACRPFDRRRSGLVLGEGAAMFVMERAGDALARGATPLAEVVALGLTCDAHHPTTPLPDGSGMRRAMERALAAGRVSASAVDWVNAHGTGTRANDAAEAHALRETFGADLPAVSGSKGALGHAMGAASALELAICVKGLREQAVPPTAGHDIPDPDGIACTRHPTPRRLEWVLNNAFAFGGLNSSLLLRAWHS